VLPEINDYDSHFHFNNMQQSLSTVFQLKFRPFLKKNQGGSLPDQKFLPDGLIRPLRFGKPAFRITPVGWVKVRLPGRGKNPTMVVSRLARHNTPMILLTKIPGYCRISQNEIENYDQLFPVAKNLQQPHTREIRSVARNY